MSTSLHQKDVRQGGESRGETNRCCLRSGQICNTHAKDLENICRLLRAIVDSEGLVLGHNQSVSLTCKVEATKEGLCWHVHFLHQEALVTSRCTSHLLLTL
jgi:hypothetical protein